MRSIECTLVNRRGLHARASARLVELVQSFDAEIEVERDDLRVDGSSILDLMMLAAPYGGTILIHASGPQRDEALAAIEELVCNRFGESE